MRRQVRLAGVARTPRKKVFCVRIQFGLVTRLLH